MEILILLAGEQIGPFTETQVRQYLEEGLVTPTDLAMHEGMEKWQAIDVVLANLPVAPATMANGKAEKADPAPAPALTDSQRTKRKLNKIVIQPILPLEATLSPKKKTQTGKTALTIETPRPTTLLPHVMGFAPKEKEKKTGRTLLRTDQLSFGDFSAKPVAAPAASVPAEPVAPLPTAEFKPPEMPVEIPTGESWIEQIPRAMIYAGLALAFLLVCAALCLIYLISSHHETPPATPATPSAVAQPAPNPVPAPPPPTPAAVQMSAADYSARGFARQAKGDLDGALADYDQALELDPRNLEACYRRGLARQAKGNWDGAVADFTAIISLNPKNADAFSNRGFVKQAQGDLDGALADYDQALLLNPKIPAAYYNEGLIKVQKGDLDGAIASYNQALDLDPKMAIAYYNRGNAKNTEGDLDGAIGDYTQALELNPRIALAYCNRGFARQSKGDADGAVADYTQAVELNPKMAVAFYNRGLIKMQKGDLDGALADSSQAIDLDPKNGQAYCNRGLAEIGKGDLDSAMADLRKFCDLAPRDSGADTARLYLWLIATQKNPKGTADEDLSTSLLNDWNSSPEDLSSKIAAFLLGHIDENELIANAASPDPSREPGQYCKAWYFIGMKRMLKGDRTKATTDLQKCVATNQKDFCEYTFAQAELQTLAQGHESVSQSASSQ